MACLIGSTKTALNFKIVTAKLAHYKFSQLYTQTVKGAITGGDKSLKRLLTGL
ncbi:hypothetical protein SBF1_990022 [Candidatus Desulfosporosinus infrequens]|uniref:Uncharacterized protein n=1 Tax=Candidatus Desulfosporosinus infrequens TaxID=2043169 RepID=A0A2U3LYL8_9FIRM|nr:hypothetical protein SBF1_990022 [Candidatus Desulfosporosinus infrequens]